jgi:outer membrane protein
LTQRMLLFFNFGISELDDEIRASPIVADNRLATAYFGLTYNFGNVKQAATPDPDRLHEWSWRVNYGYQAEGNIVGEVNVGNIKRNATATTQIGGLVVSKLLADGPRSDFLGRLGVYRHFEGGLQDDFWDFVAYIMAMGKGHLPWSDKTAFRWGFGLGFSYAQTVPIVEQLKQGDLPTQQFLNYLEMTLDFPMARAFKARAVRNCYMGVTAVHRSGIFAASELLGGVTGGADWITLHVECVR